jgi:hypothetical protein
MPPQVVSYGGAVLRRWICPDSRLPIILPSAPMAPKSMIGEPISREDLLGLLEEARWSPTRQGTILSVLCNPLYEKRLEQRTTRQRETSGREA